MKFDSNVNEPRFEIAQVVERGPVKHAKHEYEILGILERQTLVAGYVLGIVVAEQVVNLVDLVDLIAPETLVLVEAQLWNSRHYLVTNKIIYFICGKKTTTTDLFLKYKRSMKSIYIKYFLKRNLIRKKYKFINLVWWELQKKKKKQIKQIIKMLI